MTQRESVLRARGTAPLPKDGTWQKGWEKEALGEKYSASVSCCSWGEPVVRVVMTEAISWTGSALLAAD